MEKKTLMSSKCFETKCFWNDVAKLNYLTTITQDVFGEIRVKHLQKRDILTTVKYKVALSYFKDVKSQ